MAGSRIFAGAFRIHVPEMGVESIITIIADAKRNNRPGFRVINDRGVTVYVMTDSVNFVEDVP